MPPQCILQQRVFCTPSFARSHARRRWCCDLRDDTDVSTGRQIEPGVFVLLATQRRIRKAHIRKGSGRKNAACFDGLLPLAGN